MMHEIERLALFAGTTMTAPAVTTLFLDVGGVLLTNGWDHEMRQQAAKAFAIDAAAVHKRHDLAFPTYEEGKLTLDEYLDRVIFCQERPFSRQEFTAFMSAQSRPYPPMLDLIRGLKARFGLKVAVVVSSFVHFRKPDADIYRLALDVAQTPTDQVAYIEDRALFVEVAQTLGIRSIRHTDYESTRVDLAALGLSQTA
jgi:putative hydrolase of the HAD superfamily